MFPAAKLTCKLGLELKYQLGFAAKERQFYSERSAEILSDAVVPETAPALLGGGGPGRSDAP